MIISTKIFLLPVLVFLFLISGCITTESEGFVNYKAIGDVYGTKPQTVDYEEVGTMSTSHRSFVWTDCDKICREAVNDLKYKARDRGGDSLIDVNYENEDGRSKRTPTCVTNWSWGFLYGVGLLGPWVKSCEVLGVAVSRQKSKQLHQKVQEQQSTNTGGININIQNTQTQNNNNDNAKKTEKKE